MLRWIALLCATLVLGGCGAKFAYKNLNLITPWYVDDYIDLTAEQQLLFDQRLEELHRWHRNTELPQYRQLFSEIHQHLQGSKIDAEFLKQRIAQLRGHWSALIQASTPAILELSPTLSDKQREQFMGALEARNQRRLERADTPQEHKAETIEDIEKWMGPLSKQQRGLVEAYALANPDLTSETVAAHRAFQARLAELLKQTASPTYAQKMRALLADALGGTPEGERLNALRSAQLEARVALFVALWDSASDNQKRKARSRLQGYIDDIDDLIAG